MRRIKDLHLGLSIPMEKHFRNLLSSLQCPFDIWTTCCYGGRKSTEERNHFDILVAGLHPTMDCNFPFNDAELLHASDGTIYRF